MLVGVLAAWRYFRLGLTLSHYDAKAHLVVARRVIDSITPGWEQIGAVWLPLPHLINLLPVQIDVLYRSGLSGVAISIASLGLACYALTRLVLSATGSTSAAVTGAVLLVANPNLLYLQSTPMTEPLLIALTFTATWLVYEWATSGVSESPRLAGGALALAALTRYEAWPICAALVATASVVLWMGRRADRPFVRSISTLAVYPAAAIAAFVVESRATVGEWFVSTGFFVPDNPARGRALTSAVEVWWGTHQLSGYGLATIGLAAVGLIVVVSLRDRARTGLLIALSPLCAAMLPWYAFFQGHPFRIRYMVPTVAAAALATALATGLLRTRGIITALVIVVAAIESRPFDPNAPMVLEAQWDLPRSLERRQVTSCLQAGYDGQKIMASMGSLAHYMQETSAAGFSLRDYLHEGNGDIWLAALVDPQPIVGWILVEEQAEGGDMLAMLGRRRPQFFEGFSRICESGGVALYRRNASGTASSTASPMRSVHARRGSE